MKQLVILTIICILSISGKNTDFTCPDDACLPNLINQVLLKKFKITQYTSEKPQSIKVTFSRGNTYIIAGCTKSASQNLKFELFSDEKSIFSNYQKKRDKYHPSFFYSCNKTGIYHIIPSFSNADESCGIIMVGMSRYSH